MKKILKRLCTGVLTLATVFTALPIRILMIADQLSVSAIARGVENPGIRNSHFESTVGIMDIFVMIFGQFWYLPTYGLEALKYD